MNHGKSVVIDEKPIIMAAPSQKLENGKRFRTAKTRPGHFAPQHCRSRPRSLFVKSRRGQLEIRCSVCDTLTMPAHDPVRADLPLVSTSGYPPTANELPTKCESALKRDPAETSSQLVAIMQFFFIWLGSLSAPVMTLYESKENKRFRFVGIQIGWGHVSKPIHSPTASAASCLAASMHFIVNCRPMPRLA